MKDNVTDYVKEFLSCVDLDDNLIVDSENNCVVERHTSHGFKRFIGLEIELEDLDKGSPDGIGRAMEKFVMKVIESPAVQNKLLELDTEIVELKAQVAKLKKYKEYFHMQFVMNHGKEPLGIRSFSANPGDMQS